MGDRSVREAGFEPRTHMAKYIRPMALPLSHQIPTQTLLQNVDAKLAEVELCFYEYIFIEFFHIREQIIIRDKGTFCKRF